MDNAVILFLEVNLFKTYYIEKIVNVSWNQKLYNSTDILSVTYIYHFLNYADMPDSGEDLKKNWERCRLDTAMKVRCLTLFY